MVLKRKRNLKIDPLATYSVLLLRDLNIDEIEDYVEVRDTGMEIDEEKEIHLQNIMKGEKKDIPLPVIKTIANTSRACYANKPLKRRIEWTKDCGNLYIEDNNDLSEEEKLNISEINNLKIKDQQTHPAHSEDASYLKNDVLNEENNTMNRTGIIDTAYLNYGKLIKNVGDDKTKQFGKSESLINFCLRRNIIRYEKHGFESYVCFRNRIFHPTFKSRRNEALMIEKIDRMGTELATLKSMCSLIKEKFKLEEESVRTTTEALKVISKIKLNKARRRSLRKLLVEGPSKISHTATPVSLHSLMLNREKIMAINSIKVSSELYLDIKYYNEVMGVIKASVQEDQEKEFEEQCYEYFDERALKFSKYS